MVECAVCLSACAGPRDVCVTECGHHFHTSCLCQSVVHSPRCPICRHELAPDCPTTERSAVVYRGFVANILGSVLLAQELANEEEQTMRDHARELIRRELLRERSRLAARRAANEISEYWDSVTTD